MCFTTRFLNPTANMKQHRVTIWGAWEGSKILKNTTEIEIAEKGLSDDVGRD